MAMDDDNEKMTLVFRCPPELAGPAAADAGGRGPAGLVQGAAAKGLQCGHAGRRSDHQALPAVHRRHDLRLPDSAALRPQGRERRVLLGARPAGQQRQQFVRSPIDFHDAQPGGRHAVSSTTTASSSSSTISGPSRRRPAIRCCSRIRSTGPTCRSPPSPAWSIPISIPTTSCTSRRTGTT